MIELLKKLYSTKELDTEALSEALTRLQAELADAQAKLAQAQDEYGEKLVQNPGGADKLESRLAECRRDVDRLFAARDTTQRRLMAAREVDAARDLAVRWDACESALKAREAAFAKMDKALREAGAAVIAAEDAARFAWESFPARIDHSNMSPEFVSLGAVGHRLLEVASHRAQDGVINSLVWDVQQQPSLVEQHRKAAEYWLSFRSPDLPTAA